MEFDLLAFTLSPTTEVFHKCRKKDLILIAEFYNIEVPKDRKHVIKDVLFEQLVHNGILPDVEGEKQPVVVAKAVAEEVVPGINASEHVNFDPVQAIRLKELELKVKQQENENLRLKLKVVEVEADRDIKLRRLDLQAKEIKPIPVPRSRASSISSSASTPVTPVASNLEQNIQEFDVCKYIKLVPPFRESEVDAYFVAFERIAGKLRWPNDMWALLLQCSLTGKAQEICASLPIEQSLDYEVVKTAVLRAYELVPEAYRQKFRAHAKTARQTHVEFAREKRVLFEKWCLSSKITSFEQLQELLLLEDFKSCLPESVVVHLNEQKVTTLSDAAVLADEFVLTHRNIFSSVRPSKTLFANKNVVVRNLSREPPHASKSNGNGEGKATSPGRRDRRACFYCLDPDHLIAECPAWEKKSVDGNTKNVALVQRVSETKSKTMQPFIYAGTVSLVDTEPQPIVILRDTGSEQSLILKELLPFSQSSYTGSDVLLRGIEMGCERVPLHHVHLKSDLVTGIVHLAVCSQLPFEGVGLILGNDIASDQILPRPIVVNNGNFGDASFASLECEVVQLPVKQFRKVDLADSPWQTPYEPPRGEQMFKPAICEETDVNNSLKLYIGKATLSGVQRTDSSTPPCSNAVESYEQVRDGENVNLSNNGVTTEKCKPTRDLSNCYIQLMVLPTVHHLSAEMCTCKNTYWSSASQVISACNVVLLLANLKILLGIVEGFSCPYRSSVAFHSNCGANVVIPTFTKPP